MWAKKALSLGDNIMDPETMQAILNHFCNQFKWSQIISRTVVDIGGIIVSLICNYWAKPILVGLYM